ncbi:MAG: hypothetical protein H6632_08740 [Anaerolineales bacterium]|nr:hypothetical protein [Anaerolineales bacterium]
MDRREGMKLSYILSRTQKRLVFIFSLLTLSSVVLVGCGMVLPKESSEPTGSVVENVAPAMEVKDNVVPESSYYAANPELNAAQRYNIMIKDKSLDRAIPASRYYAANPELNAAHRYTATVKDEMLTGSAFYAANPEVMAAQRYTYSRN